MLASALSLSTNYTHMLDPFSLNNFPEKEISTLERVASVVIFVFLGVFTVGIVPAFFIYTAYKKVQNHSLIHLANQSDEKIQRDKETKLSLTLDETIDKIKKLDLNGKKLCLFIGRTENEELPEEEDSIWLSLDCQKVENPKYSRLHLQADFTNLAHLEKMKGLFDKVIVDFSTFKFMAATADPWRNLSITLKLSPESTLITETISMVCYEDQASSTFYQRGAHVLPFSLLGNEAACEKLKRSNTKKTGIYLNSFFREVTLNNDIYPYSYKWFEPTSFYVLKGPYTTNAH